MRTSVIYGDPGGDSVFGGAGEDHVILGAGGFHGHRFSSSWRRHGDAKLEPASGMYVSDFVAGPGGDVVDLSALLASLPDYTPGTDPFVSGLLAYVPITDAGEVVLYATVDGQQRDVAELLTFDPVDFGADNLAGFTVQSVSLTGGSGFDVLHGLFGDDTLSGLDSVDVLAGGSGDDVLIGGAGADVLYGGSGSDTADYSTSPTGVTLNLASLVLHGADGDTYCVVEGHGGDAEGDWLWSKDNLSGSVADRIENLTGSAFADHLGGDAGANVLKGGGGDDILVGAAGDDTLDGGAGSADFR